MKSFLEEVFYKPESKKFEMANWFLTIVTIISILGISLETVNSLFKYENIFYQIEIFCASVFLLEYILRIFSAEKRLDYIFSFFGMLDFISIVPTFLGLGNLTFLKSARLLRVIRFLRLLKITRFDKSISVDSDKEKDKKIIFMNLKIYLTTLIVTVFFSAILIWIAEGYREEFQNIPVSTIWSMKILLGGIVQYSTETVWGDLIAIMTRFFGLVLFGILINLVVSLFKKYFK